jgi:hypothetical protein
MSNPFATPEELEQGTDAELRDLHKIVKSEIKGRKDRKDIEQQIDNLDQQIARFEAKKAALEDQL